MVTGDAHSVSDLSSFKIHYQAISLEKEPKEKMFPWFPFLQFPEPSDRRHRRRRKNMAEEMLEVRAVSPSSEPSALLPIQLKKAEASSSRSSSTQLQIVSKRTPLPLSRRQGANQQQTTTTIMKKELPPPSTMLTDEQEAEEKREASSQNQDVIMNEQQQQREMKVVSSSPVEKESAINNRFVEEKPSLLPKASSEHLIVQFGDENAAGPSISESMIEKLGKYSRYPATASTSSSSGQLATAAIGPRSNSSGKKSATAKKRGTSGNRSGTSSAKQSPRRTHRSTDSISNHLKQAEKLATPPPSRRRKSAFETSQAMRDLFGGNNTESPFAGLEAKTVQRRRVERKEEKRTEESAKSALNDEQHEEGSEAKEEPISLSKLDDEHLQSSSRDIAQLDSQHRIQVPNLPPSNENSSKTVEEISSTVATQEVIISSTAEESSKRSTRPEEMDRIEREEEVTIQLEEGEKIGAEKSESVERELHLRSEQTQENGTTRIEDQITEKQIQSDRPASTNLVVQKNGNRPKSVARVAPFAYFPPQPEEQQVEAVQTSINGRRQIVTHQQELVHSDRAISEVAQQVFNPEEVAAELLKEQAKLNGETPKSEYWEEEEKGCKEEDFQLDWTEEDRQQQQLPNGTALPSALCEQQELKRESNTGSSSGSASSTDQHRQQKSGQQQPPRLPGDQQQGKHRQQAARNGDGTAKTLTTNKSSKEATIPNNKSSRETGQKQAKDTNGNGTFANGGDRNTSLGSTSGGGGGASGSGGGASAGGPPSSLDQLRMVNEGAEANGTAGGASNGFGPRLLIRNATVVNDDDMFMADVLIEDGVIREVSLEPMKLADPLCEQIDATGKCLLPAGIDVHTSLIAVGSGQLLALGTKAAICGGTGTIVEIVPIEGDNDVLDRVRSQIGNSAECHVAVCVAINKWRGAQSKQEMSKLLERGVNNFVLNLSSDAEYVDAFEHAKTIGALCRVSAENKQMMAMLEAKLQNQRISGTQHALAEKLEAQQIQHLCTLADLANAPVYIQSGQQTKALQAVKYCSNSRTFVAIGSEEVMEVLASHQHCVCVSGQQPSANQSSQLVEKRMCTIWDLAVLAGRIDPMRFIAVTSSNAAKFLNLYPRKGRVAVGSDADLVLWDLQTSSNTFASSQSTNVTRPQLVLIGGQVRYRQGKFVSMGNESPKIGSGGGAVKPTMFLPLTANSPHLFGVIRLREGKFNFSDFITSRQQQGAEWSPTNESRHSTRTGTPDEPTSTTTRPGSMNRNAQSDQPQSRATTKIIHPPGGKSTAFW